MYVKPSNQGEYRKESRTDRLLVLAVYKPNLSWSSPTNALRSWFGLSLTAGLHSKLPTSSLLLMQGNLLKSIENKTIRR